MVRNIVIIGGSSHAQLVKSICSYLGVPAANVLLSKFSVGETRVEIGESVRGKDVYIIQSGGGKVNDHLMELLITISACKTASAKKVTAVLPFFPYSRQSDLPYNKTGAPLARASNCYNKPDFPYQIDTAPQTPHPGAGPSNGNMNGADSAVVAGRLEKSMSKVQIQDGGSNGSDSKHQSSTSSQNGARERNDTTESAVSLNGNAQQPQTRPQRSDTGASLVNGDRKDVFHPQPGYKQWVAQAGTLVADLLTCAGADHVITMDLHDAQYQGFFDIPVDNLYGRPMLKKYIQTNVPDYRNAVVVSPDAGGAKRAIAIADSLGMPFALIHKERRPTRITDRQNATMMLVGDIAGRTAILIDDLADTSNTIVRAARLLRKEGAKYVYALITHGILSGDAIERINHSELDKVIVTNSLPQEAHAAACPKLEVLEVGAIFAEAIRRVHHGESISVLFQYD